MKSGPRLSTRAFWGLASWALPLVVVFLLSPKLLHLLGAERFGVLMIILVTPFVASQLELGISAAAVRRLARRLHAGRVDAGATLFTLFLVLLAVGLTLGAAIWLTAAAISDALGFSGVLGPTAGRDVARACALWAVASLGLVVPGLLARAAQALRMITLVQTASAVAMWTGAWLLLREGASLVGVVVLGIVLTALGAAATLFAVRNLVEWSGPLRLDTQSLADERRFAAGMFAAQAAGAIVYQGDRLLVSALATTATAGLYALCANIANKTSAAAVAINGFVMPYAAGLASVGQRDATAGLVHALDRATAAMLVPLLVPAMLLAESFLRLWIGSFATPEVVLAFRILLAAFAIPAFAMPVSNVLIAEGGAGLSAKFAWLSVAIVLVAFAVLVPRFGLVGAACGMLLANTTSLLFAASARRSLRLTPDPGRSRLWLGLVIGAVVQFVIAVLCIGLIDSWTVLLAVGAGVWAASYLVRAIFGFVSPEEKQVFARISRRAERA